jgi:hypothetical protein
MKVSRPRRMVESPAGVHGAVESGLPRRSSPISNSRSLRSTDALRIDARDCDLPEVVIQGAELDERVGEEPLVDSRWDWELGGDCETGGCDPDHAAVGATEDREVREAAGGRSAVPSVQHRGRGAPPGKRADDPRHAQPGSRPRRARRGVEQTSAAPLSLQAAPASDVRNCVEGAAAPARAISAAANAAVIKATRSKGAGQ